MKDLAIWRGCPGLLGELPFNLGGLSEYHALAKDMEIPYPVGPQGSYPWTSETLNDYSNIQFSHPQNGNGAGKK